MKRSYYKRHFDYIVVFGEYDRYNVDLIWRCRKHYRYLKEARKNTEIYSNAHIFKLVYAADSGDLLSYTEIR
jgi:hypothetical protein